MNIYELSLEAHGLLEKGRIISEFLEVDLKNLLSHSEDENIYLRRAGMMVQKIRDNQSGYLDEWLLSEHLDDGRLGELLHYINTVQAIPEKNRLYVDLLPSVLPVETSENRKRRISSSEPVKWNRLFFNFFRYFPYSYSIK